METNKNLNSYFNGAIAKALVHIVGVQFRNCATIGGSIYSRFGFSDILTCLLALDTYVELHNGGIISLAAYKDMYYDRDVLVRIIIKKDPRKTAYLTHRMSATDIPVLAVAVSKAEGKWQIVLGARPQRATLVEEAGKILSDAPTQEEIEALTDYIIKEVKFGTNMRGSKEYRQILAKALINRGIEEIMGGTHAN
jgi:CO/xanthine dehydrogenase FAD-binding subunit